MPGINGAFGNPVMQLVGEAVKYAEGQLTLWQHTVALNAQDMKKRFKHAILSAALVIFNHLLNTIDSASIQSCNLVDCSWSEWTDYGACSEECGGGDQTRVRTKTLESCGGLQCTGNDIETQPCNLQCCPSESIDEN